jgi:hypothetical protein
MKWTLRQFDRQPFPFVIELMDYFSQHPPEHIFLGALAGWKPKRGKRMKGYYNEKEFSEGGMLPSPKNTVLDSDLPPEARHARQLLRAAKMAKEIEAKKPNA